MRSARTVCAGALVAITTTGVAVAPAASADYDEYAMNGTFSVVSNGEWSQTNERYQDQPTVRSMWTVNSVCTTPITCAGKVTSSLGWTEDIYTTSGQYWHVKHPVSQWIPCPDGTRADGLQQYSFYPATDEGAFQRISSLWLGQDETTGVSGNCGRNLSLTVTLPVKITRITA
jgi:hypothetical protein